MVVVSVVFVCGAEKGVTCARMCTMNLRPVCASDGQTYSKYGMVYILHLSAHSYHLQGFI